MLFRSCSVQSFAQFEKRGIRDNPFQARLRDEIDDLCDFILVALSANHTGELLQKLESLRVADESRIARQQLEQCGASFGQ